MQTFALSPCPDVRSTKPVETTSNSEQIECPSCHATITDLWEFGEGWKDEDDIKIECDHCSASLLLTRRVSVAYPAKPREAPTPALDPSAACP